MQQIRIFFTDFGQGFVPENEYFYRLLADRYLVVLDSNDPEYVFYSCYGDDHLDYDAVKIFYTGENLRPDFNLCDYAFGFDYLEFGDRYMRLPNYARYGAPYEILAGRPPLTSEDLSRKPEFCNFIYSNAFADPVRDEFFHALNRYKKVDSPGAHLNNMSGAAGERYSTGWRDSKLDFQRNYRFTIAFENASTPGYTTEKIMHAFSARTIPIYWGNPLIAREFDTGSFINCHDFDSFAAVVERVREVDADEQLCRRMLNTPCLPGDSLPREYSAARVGEFLDTIIKQGPEQARRRARYGSTRAYEISARERRVARSGTGWVHRGVKYLDRTLRRLRT